jgi:hypothetical protein
MPNAYSLKQNINVRFALPFEKNDFNLRNSGGHPFKLGLCSESSKYSNV